MVLAMKPNLATIARYYRVGIEAGLCDPEDARTWALGVTEDETEPPPAIMDISQRQPQASLLDALASVPGDVDNDVAGRWLLAELRAAMLAFPADPLAEVRRALYVAKATDLDEVIYHEFDRIEEAMAMALSGTYGTVSECWFDFEYALQRFVPAPFVHHEQRAG